MLKMKFVIPLILFSYIAFSQVNITKTAPLEASINETITISITIKNTGKFVENLSVYEYPGDVIPIEPDELIIENTSGCMFCASPPYFLWNVSVKPKDEKDIHYKIKPKELGDLIIPATVAYDQYGNTFYSNPVTIKIKCNLNGICEPSLGENYFNCADCPSGSKDGVCDLIDDGICDPDCEIGYDDCICNENGICEWWENSTCIDCEKHKNYNIIYIALVIIIFISTILIIIVRKKHREEEIIRRIEK